MLESSVAPSATAAVVCFGSTANRRRRGPLTAHALFPKRALSRMRYPAEPPFLSERRCVRTTLGQHRPPLPCHALTRGPPGLLARPEDRDSRSLLQPLRSVAVYPIHTIPRRRASSIRLQKRLANPGPLHNDSCSRRTFALAASESRDPRCRGRSGSAHVVDSSSGWPTLSLPAPRTVTRVATSVVSTQSMISHTAVLQLAVAPKPDTVACPGVTKPGVSASEDVTPRAVGTLFASPT